MSNWQEFALSSFDSMKASLYRWKETADPSTKRSLTRLFYDQIFCSGDPNRTGYISLSAMDNKKNKKNVCTDHCLSPQFVARMIYDHPEVWLSDFDKFKNLFYQSCLTIKVTPEENTRLSKLTDNSNGQFSVYVPTHQKYDHLGIKLFHPEKGFVTENIFVDLVPTELMEYEKQYLVES